MHITSTLKVVCKSYQAWFTRVAPEAPIANQPFGDSGCRVGSIAIVVIANENFSSCAIVIITKMTNCDSILLQTTLRSSNKRVNEIIVTVAT